MSTRFFKLGTVNVTNGNDLVTGTGTSFVNAIDAIGLGDIFTVDHDTIYEVVEIVNDTTIRLGRNYEGSTQSGINYSIIRHGSANDISKLSLQITYILNTFQDFIDQSITYLTSENDTETLTDRHGNSIVLDTVHKAQEDFAAVQAQAESLVGSVVLPNQAEFESRHEGKYAGAGFVEWGYHSSSVTEPNVNNGIYMAENASYVNGLWTGRGDGGFTVVGNSQYPLAYIAGCILHINRVNTSTTQGRNFIKFPTAPDGLDKADGTGRFANLAEAITAGTTTLGASVIYRQDLWGVEVTDVNITTSGLPLYPYGNTQYGGTWSGITLADNLVAQGYSAQHVGDTTTKGKGFLPDLTNDNHVKFIQDKRNNCYRNHLGEIIQRQYRQRTIAGLNGDWENVSPLGNSSLTFSSSPLITVGVQGTSTTPVGLVTTTTTGYFTCPDNGNNNDKITQRGAFAASKSGGDNSVSDKAYNGNCWFIPIALVQRRNQGAYHPVYNIAGASRINANVSSSAGRIWGDDEAVSIANVSECLTPVNIASDTTTAGYTTGSGSLSTGYSGRPDGKFYDAIHASDVLDLRMSAHYVDYDTVNRVENAKNINATARGWEALPCVGKASDFQLAGVADIYADNGRFLFTRPDGISGYIDTSPSITQSLDGLCWFFADTNNGDIYKMARWGNKFHTRVRKWNGSSWEALSSATQLDGLDLIAIPYDGRNISDADRLDINNFFYTGYPNGTDGYYYLGTEYCVKPEHLYKLKIPYYQAEPTWTDIIADPSVLAAAFPGGVVGSWIPYLPAYQNATNGTGAAKPSSAYPLNKKPTSFINAIKTEGGNNTLPTIQTNSVGITDPARVASHYGNGSIAWTNTEKNIVGLTNEDTDNAVILVNCKSKANFVESASTNLDIVSELSPPFISNHKSPSYGCILCQSTVGKIPTSPGSNASRTIGWSELGIVYSDLVLDKGNWAGGASKHNSFNLPGTNSPAFKCFSYVVNKNGQLYQQVIVKEIIHDPVDGFGDNNLFEITDGVATKTDLNGNTIIYGCWERPLPYWTNNKVN